MTAAVLSVCLLAGCGKAEELPDAEHPITVSIWHYYNGVQQIAFDELVKEFNETVGREQGIYVEGKSQGDVTQLEDAVLASIRKEVGSEETPDMFSCYADTAFSIERMGGLADISEYLTEKELDTYMDSYIEEGRIGKNGELCIFPTAKSSEIFMLNRTEWEKFAEDTGASTDDLATLEGVVETARRYYEWTDGLTPDIKNDGKAFYGRDAMANLFIIGSMQLGSEIFQVQSGKVTLNIDKSIMKRIWDTWYVPYVKGYFGAYGRFRSDDVKIGEVAAYTGSTASAMYFPDAVEGEDGIRPIDYMVLPAPRFADGDAYAVQQGAGMVVSRTTKAREYACVTFLKWFTEEENNIVFGCTSGYMPVKKAAYDTQVLDRVIKDHGLEVQEKTYDTLREAFRTVKECTMYTNKAFEGGTDARKVLESHLSDWAAADRESVKALMEQGKSLEEAAADFTSEEAFEAWFDSFDKALREAVEND